MAGDDAAGDGELELDFTLTVEAIAPAGIAEDELARLSQFVLGAEGARGSWEIAVALVDDARLQALHRDFMGIDSPTDIMTFPIGDDGTSNAQGGDLVISVDHAQTQAAAWGLTPPEETQFLVIHGLLHLLGWRDDSDTERRAMLERQQALFERWRGEVIEQPEALT
jgi:probable rRNA maturation factor